MPTSVTHKAYACDICKEEYQTLEEAKECQSRPISQDRQVKKGDIVLITSGQGSGSNGKVTRTWVIDQYWGHYAWKRYWHTMAVEAEVIGGYGSRMLTFDDYEVIGKKDA